MNNKMIAMLDTIEPIHTTDSDYEYNGIKVPRVTKIIQRCIHSDSLMYWANSLGFKHMSYKRTLNASANIGSHCHNNIDMYIEDDSHKINGSLPVESQFAFNSFVKWFNTLKIGNAVEVIFHEKTLICKYFGGTLDGLYRINGKIYLVDYKTSNHITFNYFLQLAAYRYMLRVVLGIEVDGCIVLQLSKSAISYNEYVLNFNIPDHLVFINDCEMAFLSLVFSYYNISKIENEFKSITWRKLDEYNRDDA